MLKKLYSVLPIEHKIVILTCITGIVFSLVGCVVNWKLGMNIGTIIPCILMFITSLVGIILILKKKNYILTAHLCLLVLSAFFMPSMWIFNGGLTGSIPYYFLIVVFCTAVVFNKIKTKMYIFWLQLSILIGLICLEVFFPSIIYKYPDKESQYIDIALAIIVLVIMIFTLLNSVMKEYNLALEKIQIINKDLTIKNEELYQMNITDALTGIYNRRLIFQKLDELKIKGKSESFPLTILMIDIDHFKKVNDTYGHKFGDEVLIAISNHLTKQMKNTSLIARVGGEEFLAVMLNTSLKDGLAQGEKLRRSIEEMKWDKPEFSVTISCGVHEADNVESIDYIVNTADKALYKAKDKGRNRVIGI